MVFPATDKVVRAQKAEQIAEYRNAFKPTLAGIRILQVLTVMALPSHPQSAG